jgi:hypothetical protein
MSEDQFIRFVPTVSGDRLGRQFMAVAMASEIVALLDELHGLLANRLTDDPDSVELVRMASDRATDIVESMREQVGW